MFVVYVLISLRDRQLYIGLTGNITKRLNQHHNGEVKSTRLRRPLKLIHYEVYGQKSDAERREKYLKGGNGRASLKVQIQDQLKIFHYRYL